jgi:hypothetical protein
MCRRRVKVSREHRAAAGRQASVRVDSGYLTRRAHAIRATVRVRLPRRARGGGRFTAGIVTRVAKRGRKGPAGKARQEKPGRKSPAGKARQEKPGRKSPAGKARQEKHGRKSTAGKARRQAR